MDWGKWGYFNSFWVPSEIPSFSLWPWPVAWLPSCSGEFAGEIRRVTVVSEWHSLQQFYHPSSSSHFEELLVSHHWAHRSYHLRYVHFSVTTSEYLLLFPILNVCRAPYSFISQHPKRPTHHSSPRSSLKSSVHQLSPPGLKLNNHHGCYSSQNNLISRGVTTWKIWTSYK